MRMLRITMVGGRVLVRRRRRREACRVAGRRRLMDKLGGRALVGTGLPLLAPVLLRADGVGARSGRRLPNLLLEGVKRHAERVV